MVEIFLETRMFRLSDGEEIMTLAFFVLIQYRSVSDGQTDIPPLAIPAVCIARYANALVKFDTGSDHVAKFRGDRPRELRDYATKKKEKHHEQNIRPPVAYYCNGRPNNFVTED